MAKAKWKDLIGRERLYNTEDFNRDDVVLWDVLNVKPEQEIYLKFISTNSKHRQGVRIAVDVGEGYLEVNGVRAKGMQLWEYNSPKVVKIKCVTDSGLLSVYNIYERRSDGTVMSQMYKCGMLIEEQGNKRIYRCSENSDEGNFDRLVFQIELL